MKKLLLLGALAAAVASVPAWGAEQTAEATRMTPAGTLKKAPMAAPAEWKFDVSADDIIYDQPAGELKLYSKAANYYGSSMWGIMEGSSDGLPCNVVEGENGEFYIYNPFSALDSKTWLKAQVEGDRMTVKLPQAIYADSDGENNYVYVAQMCHYEPVDEESGLYYANEGETEILFSKEGDSWVMHAPEEVNEHPVIMGLVAADDGTWCAFSDWNMRFTPFNGETVTPPASLRTEKWLMTFPLEGNYICGNPVTIGIDGSDIYMKGFSESFPEGWIKGTIADGKATFPSGQFIGADEMSNTFAYFYGASAKEVYDEEWDFWYTVLSKDDALVFDINPETGEYTTEGTLLVNKGDGDVSTVNSYTAPTLKLQEEVTDFVPMDPIPGYYSAPGDYMGCLYFDFPILNTKGQLLDTSNLYYRVIVDDDVFVFYSDEYAGVEDGTEAIPFDFSNMETIGRYSTCNVTHFFYFSFSGFETLDIQTFYLDGDTEYASKKVRVVGEDVSVDGIASGSMAVAEQWFDLSGRRVVNPENGIYMKRVEYSDGTVRTFKTVVR